MESKLKADGPIAGSVGDDQDFNDLLDGFGDAYGAYQSGQNSHDESIGCRAELVAYIDSIIGAAAPVARSASVQGEAQASTFEDAMRKSLPTFPLDRLAVKDGDKSIAYVSAGTQHAWHGYLLAATSTPAAPAAERDTVLEQARVACQMMAEGAGRGEYREACHGCANAIQQLKYEVAAPASVLQPIDLTALFLDAAAECSNPDQMAAFERWLKDDASFAGRLVRCINKRQAAAPSVPQLAVPQGYKLVPVEPTLDMLEAAQALDGGNDDVMAAWSDAYAAMLGAAPDVAQPVPKLIDAARWRAAYRDDLGDILDAEGNLVSRMYGKECTSVVAAHNRAIEEFGRAALAASPVPPPVGQSEALNSTQQFWIENRAKIIAAIQHEGFTLMSNQNGFFLMRHGKAAAQIAPPATLQGAETPTDKPAEQ